MFATNASTTAIAAKRTDVKKETTAAHLLSGDSDIGQRASRDFGSASGRPNQGDR